MSTGLPAYTDALLILAQSDPISVRVALDNSYSWRDAVTWLIGIATFFVVLWYTIETRKMQQAVREQVTAVKDQSEILKGQALTLNQQAEAMNAQIEASRQQITVMQQQTAELIHQRRLSIMPAMIAETVRLDIPRNEPSMADLGYRLRLVNIGNGTALAIQVAPVRIHPRQPLPDDLRDESRLAWEKARLIFDPIAFLNRNL